MSVLDKLTEGIVNRDLQREGAALLEKWENTGLLEGLTNDATRQSMSRLLENQARELLREASAMHTGDVEGFAAVAFPIVRRVFGSLIANDLVSVQPMSLPSGLIFFLDFQHTSNRLGLNADLDGIQGTPGTANSLYGGGVVGVEITGGVNLGDENVSLGPYNLNQGYSSPTGSSGGIAAGTSGHAFETWANVAGGHHATNAGVVASGTFGGKLPGSDDVPDGVNSQAEFDALCRFDPDFTSGTTNVCVIRVPNNSDTFPNLNEANLQSIVAKEGTDYGMSGSMKVVRRLTQFSGSKKDHILLFFATDTTNETGLHQYGMGLASAADNPLSLQYEYALADAFNSTSVAAGSTNAVGAVVGLEPWGLEKDEGIPEIDIKVDSVSVTAITKKLKAKWTPELGQDLNAYHNLDAEVELTGILSEQIALEIDREILEDLVKGSTASTYHWSRRPGKFLDRTNGQPISNLNNESLLGADFTGTVSEWYETLVETINDVSAQIHRKTLRGGANFIVVGPEVANILEFTSGFRADVTGDTDRGTVGTIKTGSLSKKWDIYVDPYFLRNVVLIGRKGGSFLESGYVYAPYVPLQVTPTIFGVEDFVPRKGVMTRYAKKMVRPDMYGLVVVQDLRG